MHLLLNFCRPSIPVGCCALIASLIAPTMATGQVRGKKPDRGVYQSPRVASARRSESSPAPVSESSSELAELIRAPKRLSADQAKRETTNSLRPDEDKAEVPVVAVPLTDSVSAAYNDMITRKDRAANGDTSEPGLRPVGHNEVILIQPGQSLQATPIRHSGPVVQSEPVVVPDPIVHAPPIVHGETWSEEGSWSDVGGIMHDNTCDGCPECLGCDDGCDSLGCDSLGCDSMGCNPCGPWGKRWWQRRWSNASLCLSHDRWFGSAELMLMFRKGDRLPPLVTTGPEDATDPSDPTAPPFDVAGQLGQASTTILVGGQTELKDMTVGGRFTIGTWLDRKHCQSLVIRGWFAGEETFSFDASQDTIPVITRPFLNVTDTLTPEQDTQLVAFPNRASGSIHVNASSDVFGGDIQIRQFACGRYGATVDFLYGYQYMRLNEDLSILNTSTSLNDDFAPLGSVISVTDVFDTENEFHGGQFGFATRYREGCWSFNGQMKFGFGSLRRRSKLNGTTFTSIDGANAVDPNGLLVRSTNDGTVSDSTFGWVPELDLSLGWHKFPRFDVTVGYHLIAMTDALQVSDAIDPQLAVNLADPPLAAQRPATFFSYDTYYVQGIHFGIQKVY